MSAIYLAWLAAFCVLLRPGCALIPDFPLYPDFDLAFERKSLEVDGLLPGKLRHSIDTVKKVRDALRDIELPSPFWPHEQDLFIIFDELLYGLRAAVRSSTMELEEMKRTRYYGPVFSPHEANQPYRHGSPATEHHFPRQRPTELNHIDTEYSEEVDGRGLQHPRPMRHDLLDGHISRFGRTKNRHMNDMVDLPMTY